MLKTYDFLCETCTHRLWTTMDPEEVSWESRWECPVCSQPTLKKIPSAPLVLKASYLDGQRKQSADWQNLREAHRLEAESMDMPVNSRTAIKKEIQKLKKA